MDDNDNELLAQLFVEEENTATVRRHQQQSMLASLLRLFHTILPCPCLAAEVQRLARGGTRSGIVKSTPCYLTLTTSLMTQHSHAEEFSSSFFVEPGSAHEDCLWCQKVQ
jgi:hypothetical protein